MKEQLQKAREAITRYDEIHQRTLKEKESDIREAINGSTEAVRRDELMHRIMEYERRGVSGEIRALAMAIERMHRHLVLQDAYVTLLQDQKTGVMSPEPLALQYIKFGAQPPPTTISGRYSRQNPQRPEQSSCQTVIHRRELPPKQV